MTPDTVMSIGQDALRVTVLLAAPLLLTALAAGLAISLLQAATQVQEMTLSFIPKLIAMAIAVLVAGHWMLMIAIDFTQRLYASIPSLIG